MGLSHRSGAAAGGTHFSTEKASQEVVRSSHSQGIANTAVGASSKSEEEEEINTITSQQGSKNQVGTKFSY